MKVLLHLSAPVVISEVTNYALDLQIEKKKLKLKLKLNPKEENTDPSPPKETPEGVTKNDPHESTATVQEEIMEIPVDPGQTIDGKQSSDVSLGQVEDTERFEKIYHYEGTPWRVMFLIFISYGVAGVFSAILAGLLDVPGFWFPYAITIIWMTWYFWDLGITCALVLQRTFPPLTWEVRRGTAAAMTEGV
jgi:hypothetical protein